MESDSTLLERWRGGDGEAGNRLFDRHFAGVFRFFQNKVGDAAEDLVQRTFLACVEGREQLRGESTFRTYLFGIARYQLYGHFRARRRSPELDVGASRLEDLGPSPSGLLGHRRDERLLLEALRTVPLDLQITLELFYWEQLTGPELAEVLGIPEGTVRSRLRRAREAVRERLRELEKEANGLSSTLEDLDAWAESLSRLSSALQEE